METILNLYKPVGLTPLETIQRFRERHPEYTNVPMTYAGRLDPAAEGALLILAGDAVREKDILIKLDKKYSADILFGFETDTYDALGIAKRSTNPIPTDAIAGALQRFMGANLLKVPAYSSRIVNGKPMYFWARQGKLGDMQIPLRTMTVHDLHVSRMRDISAAEILAATHEKINKVSGDFRQAESKKSWEHVLEGGATSFPLLTVELHVSSGTYIRSIVHELGQRLGCGAVLFNLRRTAVGEHTIDQSQTV